MSSNSPKSSENPSATPAEPQAPATTATPQEGAGQPFRRGQITWGRPPQAVFRAGPLPRDEGMARLMAMPPHPQAKPATPRISGSSASGLGGGNIPMAAQLSAAPAQAPQPAPKPAPQPAPQPAQPAPSLRPANFLGGSLVPGANLPRPRPAPAPAPTPEAEPVKVPEPAPEPVKNETIEAPRLEAPAQPTPEPKPEPKSELQPTSATPEVVVPSRADDTPARSKLPLILLAGAGVLALAAGAYLLSQNRAADSAAPVPEQGAVLEGPSGEVATLPEPVVEGDAPSVAPAATATDTVSRSNPDLTPAPQAAAQRPATPAASATPAPRPQATAPAASTPAPRPAPQQAAPQTTPQTQIQTRPAPAQPAPVVTVTPPAAEPSGPPPTVASAPPSDPDAPVVTRPQRLD